MDKALEFQPISLSAIKLTYLVSYVYARMVVSAIKSPTAVSLYATSEAKRAGLALRNDASGKEMLRLSEQLGLTISRDKDTFIMPFEQYLGNLPKREKFSLTRQRLKDGRIYLEKELVIGFLESRIKKEISKGLPIPSKELPKEVLEAARAIKVPVSKSALAAGKDTGARYRWIEKLIETPIPDVRHRTVNLILAPYLTNVRGLAEEEATKIIEQYIERCKQIEPNTNVNASYIRYQCHYAKTKGMKPLSMEKARELIGAFLEI